MSNSLWIGDVGAHWDEQYVAGMFSGFAGFKGLKLMTRSGYGFVDFDSPDNAAAAMQAMQGRPTGQYGTVFRLNWACRDMIGPGGQPLATTNDFSTGTTLGPEYSVFVGDLAYDVTEDMLRAAFGRYRSLLSIRVVHDPTTGLSKGFGFVRFATFEDQQRAIVEMNGTTLGNRQMRISEAAPKGIGAALHQGPDMAQPFQPFVGSSGTSRAPYSGFRPPIVPRPPAYPAYAPPPRRLYEAAAATARPPYAPIPTIIEGQTTIFVGGLDSRVDEIQLYRLFASVGPVSNVKVPKDKGCAFVQFQYRADAGTALVSLNGTLMGNGRIRLAWSKNQLNSRTPFANDSLPDFGGLSLYDYPSPQAPRAYNAGGTPRSGYADPYAYTPYEAPPYYEQHPLRRPPRGSPPATRGYEHPPGYYSHGDPVYEEIPHGAFDRQPAQQTAVSSSIQGPTGDIYSTFPSAYTLTSRSTTDTLVSAPSFGELGLGDISSTPSQASMLSERQSASTVLSLGQSRNTPAQQDYLPVTHYARPGGNSTSSILRDSSYADLSSDSRLPSIEQSHA